MNAKKNAVKWLLWGLIALLIYFPVFLRLTSFPIQVWDESLFGLRALYMADTGSYLSNFNLFDGLIDHRNTKLPFTTFFQVIGIKLFGVNELAIRLPISVIFLSTVLFVIYFFKKNFKTAEIGGVFVLLLITCVDFVKSHMLRSGDQDVPFACYLLVAILCFYHYVNARSIKALVGFTLAMIAALLTKNVLAGLIAPGILTYLLVQGKFLSVIQDKRIWFSLLSIILVYAGTIVYLEGQYPGFINRMWEYELLGRYKVVIENHKGGPFFYLKEFFRPYFILFVLFLAAFFDKKMDPRLRGLGVILCSCFCSYLLIISMSQTKIYWYAAPLFPLASLLLSIVIWHLWNTYILDFVPQLKWAIMVLAFAIFSGAYYDVVTTKTQWPDYVSKRSKYGLFIEHLAKISDKKDYKIFEKGRKTSIFYYKEMYNRSYGYNLDLSIEAEFQKGDQVLCCTNNSLQEIKKNYNIKLLEKLHDCRLIEINQLK